MVRIAGGERKTIFDPIHGSIQVRGAALELIGLPPFQRLWGIRQTGFAHLVFPGANHTRLEHSLGVYAVAQRMAESLALDASDAMTVAIGGLLHDLGHGPFSHTLEPSMREVLGYGHEKASRRWIQGNELWPRPHDHRPLPSIPHVLERHGLVPRAIADLVDPPTRRERYPLLRSVLHGAIDADRIDYLQRDAHYTGVAHGTIDAVRLLDTARRRGDRMVFAEKGRHAVEGFLVGRALMYASVYYHKAVRAAEVMAQAAVERSVGYPDAARELFGQTDAEVLTDLGRADGPPGQLIRALRERRLYKRVYGWSDLGPSERRHFERLLRRPEERRQEEARIAEELGASPGSVLFDLAGLEGRTSPDADLGEVTLEEDGGLTHPFRGPGVWRALAVRSPTRSPVSLYLAPRLTGAGRRAVAKVFA